MATVTKEFDSYKLDYQSGHPNLMAFVSCYLGSSRVGRILFCKDVIPDNKNASFGPEIYFPLSRFDDVVAMLRLEKPLYLSLNTGNLIGWIATDEQESVGEEES